MKGLSCIALCVWTGGNEDLLVSPGKWVAFVQRILT